MSLEDIIIWSILILIIISIVIIIVRISNKNYIFKMSDFTEVLVSCITLGLAIATCYVLFQYAIYNKITPDSTSTLAIRLFSLLGGFYLLIKSLESYVNKINEVIS